MAKRSTRLFATHGKFRGSGLAMGSVSQWELVGTANARFVQGPLHLGVGQMMVKVGQATRSTSHGSNGAGIHSSSVLHIGSCLKHKDLKSRAARRATAFARDSSTDQERLLSTCTQGGLGFGDLGIAAATARGPRFLTCIRGTTTIMGKSALLCT